MKKLRVLSFVLVVFCFLAQSAHAQDNSGSSDSARYQIEDGWIVGHNLPRYNNRPLYLRESRAFILTGDRPIVRMAKDSRLYGTVYFTFERQGKRLPFDKFSEIKSSFRADEARWEMEDSSFPGTRVFLSLLPLGSDGFVASLNVEGMEQGDSVEWFYGGPEDLTQSSDWAYDALGRPELLTWDVGDRNKDAAGIPCAEFF